jgi:hypothetical protein
MINLNHGNLMINLDDKDLRYSNSKPLRSSEMLYVWKDKERDPYAIVRCVSAKETDDKVLLVYDIDNSGNLVVLLKISRYSNWAFY